MLYWADEELSHKLAVAWNNAASAAHQAYPSRLVSLLTLPMLYPERALDELKRASMLPGMRGVYMGTNVNHHDLDDPLFEPIFARIEQLELPIAHRPAQEGFEPVEAVEAGPVAIARLGHGDQPGAYQGGGDLRDGRPRSSRVQRTVAILAVTELIPHGRAHHRR